MRKYEITYLVSDEVRENDLNKVTGAVAGFVTELGGKVEKEEIWGRRKLAYPIKKADFATYVTLNFEMPSEKCPEFEREIRHNTSVIRHLVIVKEHGHEKISLSKAEIAEADDIEEVVGGEKSFEAIEGQTEESRDLMAKREVEEEQVPSTEERVEYKPQSPELPDEPTPENPELPEEKPENPIAEKTEEKKPVEKKKLVAKTEKVEKPKTAKPSTSLGSGKAVKTEEGEAERLSKLNDELDDILKDEL